MEKEDIRQNIERVLKGIKEAGAHAPVKADVKLLLATKTVNTEDIAYAVNECGVRYIGENRVPELLEKYEELKKLPCSIHFIGTLQKNKVKYICDKVDCIHSVDSLPLALEIDKRCGAIGRVMDVYAEVNIGREESKGGVDPDLLLEFADSLTKLKNIRLSGVMTMAPRCESDAEYEKYFTKTYRLYIDFCKKISFNRDVIPELSMGMSNSYEAAVRCGSTLVRVGSAVFGERAKQ